jgi:hypothetical protein
MFKDFPYAIVHFGGTFEVLYRTDLAGNGLSLHTENAQSASSPQQKTKKGTPNMGGRKALGHERG